MGRRRTLLLITSILLAAVGTALIGIYVRGADTRAQKGQELISVLVVQNEIPAGTSESVAAHAGGFLPGTRRSSDVEGPVITDLTTISGQLTTTNLLPGQVLQPAMFSATATSNTRSIGITPGNVGGAFQLTDPQRVAGILQPGMSVMVFDVPAKANENASILLKSVKVIKVGNEGSATAATSSTSSSSSTSTSTNADDVARTIITFDLEPTQMSSMLKAERDGTLALGVLGSGSGS